jgi:hypothetical protein
MDINVTKGELNEFLTNSGCCRYCVLRFLRPNFDDFLKVENFVKNVNLKLVN